MNIALDQVEPELAKLWAEHRARDAHPRTLDLVAFCATPDELPRVRAALAPLASKRPCRTLTVVCYPAGSPSITARVALHVDTARRSEPVGEDVSLDVRGTARSWVPSAVRQLRRGDLPMHLWWAGDLPDDDRLFDQLLDRARNVAQNESTAAYHRQVGNVSSLRRALGRPSIAAATAGSPAPSTPPQAAVNSAHDEALSVIDGY